MDAGEWSWLSCKGPVGLGRRRGDRAFGDVVVPEGETGAKECVGENKLLVGISRVAFEIK